MADEKRHNLSIETLEKCVAIAAYVLTKHDLSDGDIGMIFIVMRDALELAKQDDPAVQARRFLESYTRDGGTNAIFSKKETEYSNV